MKREDKMASALEDLIYQARSVINGLNKLHVFDERALKRIDDLIRISDRRADLEQRMSQERIRQIEAAAGVAMQPVLRMIENIRVCRSIDAKGVFHESGSTSKRGIKSEVRRRRHRVPAARKGARTSEDRR